ncbi:MAG TPA: ATP-binding protein [Daejeonella sp.]|uniref:AAA family ATPase n=1 Tax=Daejeonella sp. TaxID=2805397 RepID=UPI002EDABD73
MIINFSVQNFGSIKEKQTLSFEADRSDHLEEHYIINTNSNLRLLKLALIYGANASGKTTILKALDFLRQLVLEPVEKKTDTLNFYPFLFDPQTPKQNSIISIDFIQNEVRYSYEVEFNKNAISKEELHFFNPNKANVFKRSTDLDKQFSEITFGNKIKKDKTFEKTLESNTLWNNSVLGGFLKTNIESKELKEVIDWFATHLKRLILTNTQLDNSITRNVANSEINKFDILNVLKKADFNISDIILKEDKEMPESVLKILTALDLPKEEIDKLINTPLKKIEFEHTVDKIKYTLPISQESQGTQRYYGFSGLLSLLVRKSIIIPIDELESSLHPELFTHFLLSFLINSKKSQIIATTHNREILNNKDIFRNDSIWFTDKSETCATELYSLSDFDSSIVRDTSNIFNAYKAGKLGGTPNLGDYYIDFNDEDK